MCVYSRIVGTLAISALVAAACGGSDPDAITPPTGETAQTTTTASEGEASEPGENVATVVIGSTTFQFDLTPDAMRRCDPDFFGAFWGIGGGAGGTDSGLELLLPPEGDANFDDPPTINVRDGVNDQEWRADPEFWAPYAPMAEISSQVDSWTIDGFSASGVATFVESNAAYAFIGGTGDAPVPVTGTFEVVCAGQ